MVLVCKLVKIRKIIFMGIIWELEMCCFCFDLDWDFLVSKMYVVVEWCVVKWKNEEKKVLLINICFLVLVFVCELFLYF